VAFCFSEPLFLPPSPGHSPGYIPFFHSPPHFRRRLSLPAPCRLRAFRRPGTPIPGGAPTAAGNALTTRDKATASIPPDSARDLRAARPS